MFYAIDKVSGEILLSINIRLDNYKNSYNKSLRYNCCGCNENGDKCNDKNVTFVNSNMKLSHFRHSKKAVCSASKDFKVFNTDFYKNWFELFKIEYRKPYWFNINLEQIRNDDNIIMIRYSHQTVETIKNVEKYVNENTKIIWILSLENRKYYKIHFYNGCVYIDFKGNKNDIPIFDNNKSIVYLDTGFNILLKVKLESYCHRGQEIELYYMKDFCKQYDNLLTAYPYRKRFEYLDTFLKEQEKYNTYIKYLLEEYNKCEYELKTTKTVKEQIFKLRNIYDKLIYSNYNSVFDYNDMYDFFNNKVKYDNDINIINIELYKYYDLYKYNILEDYLKNNVIEHDNILGKLYELKNIYEKILSVYKLIYIKNEKLNITEIINENDKIYNDKIYHDYISIFGIEYNINICDNKLHHFLCIILKNIETRRIEHEKNIEMQKIENEKNIEMRRIEKEKNIETQRIENEKNIEIRRIEKEKKLKRIKNQKKKIEKEIIYKQESDRENIIVKQRYNNYIEKYNVNDKELIHKLLEIIYNNYQNIIIKNIEDDYLHKYYIYITHHLNYDINKMIKFIIYQEKC